MTSHGVPRASTAPRTAQAIEEDRVKIDAYNALVTDVQGLKASKTYTKASLSSTSSLLEQNPEFNTIWNFRRRIVLHLLTSPEEPSKSEGTEEAEEKEKEREKNKLSFLSSELTFLLPLLQKYPKCYWIWNYRLFILQTASEKLNLVVALKLWKAEMGLVNKMLSRDSRNFHGWGYRRYLVQSIERLREQQRGEEKEEKSSGNDDDDDEEESLVEQEFAYTTAMYGKDLSNFSAWHNRSKLIPRMLTERGATLEERITFLDGELGEMQTAVYTDPYDQSIQLYNHWLLLESCSPNSSPSDTSEVFPLAADQKSETLLRTLDWMRELLEEEPECRLLLEEMIFVGGLLRAVGGGDVDDEGIRADMQAWLEKLMEVDPMRGGRWREMKGKL